MTLLEDRRALLKGMRAAETAHRNLGTRDALGRSVRIDVFGTIVRSGATLMFQPLDKLMGAFFRAEETAGILITTERPIGLQRFTAAHELGHMLMGHKPHADDEEILRRAPIASGAMRAPPQEREADAFASSFLLPNWLLSKLVEQQKWSLPALQDSDTLYQASLRMGASYSATIYAFERNNAVSRGVQQDLLKVQPRTVKQRLVADLAPSRWQNTDVWKLTERDEGAVIEANRTDLFVIRLKEHGSAGYIWTFDELERAGFVILKDAHEALTHGRIGAPTLREVVGETNALTAGTYTLREQRPFDPENDPHQLSFHFSPSHSDEKGIWRPQREALLRRQ
ncbi:MAG TPA: hypothetical protein DHW63_00250 [Hyphomonadaceae bacterium]|nr:hypothetical protein [Hyphomonadaceae bacterium]